MENCSSEMHQFESEDPVECKLHCFSYSMNIRNMNFLLQYKHNRVTSLEQLSLAELRVNRQLAKVYENDHKNVPGIWFHSVWKVKIWALFIDKVHTLKIKVIKICQ